MNFKLIVQSLSPLALLTIIRNWNFILEASNGEKLSLVEFIQANLVLLIVIGICAIWVVLSLVFLLSLGVFKYADKKTGYTVVNTLQQEKVGLDFFLTLIVPLVVDDANTLQGALALLFVVTITMFLLSQTNLFYANPILIFLGYRVYEFEFESNKDFKGQRVIGLVHGTLKDEESVEYKSINDKVLYVKRMKL